MNMNILLYAPGAWPISDALLDPSVNQIQRLQGGLSDMLSTISLHQPDLVLLTGLDAGTGFLKELENLCIALPQATVVVYQPQVNPGMLMDMMRAGVRDVLMDCQPQTVRQVLDRAAMRRQNALPFKSRIYGIITAKGGDGGSCVAANLAYAMAQQPGTRVALLDLSQPFGDLEMYLTNQTDLKDLADVSAEADRLDRSLLDSMLHHVTPNLHLVVSPATFDKVVRLQPEHVLKLIEITSRHYNHVILDMGTSLDQINLSALDKMSEITLVGSTNLPSIRHITQILKLLKTLDYPDNIISVVVNQFSSRSPITQPELEKAIGKSIRFLLPTEHEGVQNSLLKGKTVMELLPDSTFAQTITTWASQITGIAMRKKSLWQRLRMK